jgi:hypothetical protein
MYLFGLNQMLEQNLQWVYYTKRPNENGIFEKQNMLKKLSYKFYFNTLKIFRVFDPQP